MIYTTISTQDKMWYETLLYHPTPSRRAIFHPKESRVTYHMTSAVTSFTNPRYIQLWHDVMSTKQGLVNKWVGRITSSPAWCSNKTTSHHATPLEVGRPDQSLKPKCRPCRPRWQSLLRDTTLLPPYQFPSRGSSIPPKFQHHKDEDTWQLASSQPAEQQRQPQEHAKNHQLVFNTNCLISRKCMEHKNTISGELF